MGKKANVIFIMLAILMIAGNALAQQITASDQVAYSMKPVNLFNTEDAVADASSVLVRNGDEVAMMLHTNELPPGEAFTVWWVIFNNPEACSDGICNGDDLPQNGGEPEVNAAMLYADGDIVDATGSAHFTARLDVEDATNAYVFETQGLTEVENAEIHLVVRTHGPALEDAELLEAQLTTFNGGCETGSETTGLPGPNTCTNIQSSIHIAGA